MLRTGSAMNLKDYLFLSRTPINDFAEKLGCSRSYLSRVINGHILPGKRLAKDIEQATNGEVTIKELLYNTEE